MSDSFDDPWWNDVTVPAVDKLYPDVLTGSIRNGKAMPYPLVGEAAPTPFDHAFAGVIPYVVESGSILLQQRDGATVWNPGKISIFGGRVVPGEIPSVTAVRELAEETGIVTTAAYPSPLRAYIENRVRVPVFRAIYVLMLDRVPPELRPGEGAGIIHVRVSKVDEVELLTMLSSEDIQIFLDHWYPRRAA